MPPGEEPTASSAPPFVPVSNSSGNSTEGDKHFEGLAEENPLEHEYGTEDLKNDDEVRSARSGCRRSGHVFWI